MVKIWCDNNHNDGVLCFINMFSYTVTHCDRIYGEWIFRQIFKGKLKRIQYTSNTIAIVSRAIKLTNILIPIVCRKMMEC